MVGMVRYMQRCFELTAKWYYINILWYFHIFVPLIRRFLALVLFTPCAACLFPALTHLIQSRLDDEC